MMPGDGKIRALLVDDDLALVSLLEEYFAGHDVVITHAGDGEAALVVLDRGADFDVVLLDVMLPGLDGFEICKQIRARHAVPIVMLTARGDDQDRIVGLELGADDYVPKPFNPRELLARVRAVLRRTKPASAGQGSRLVVGPFSIDIAGLRVERDGVEIALTSYEFRILVELAKRAGETVAREELAAAVDPNKAKGGYDPSVDRSLDVHLSRLRQKLEDDPKEPRFLKTVRGVGYVFARPS